MTSLFSSFDLFFINLPLISFLFPFFLFLPLFCYNSINFSSLVKKNLEKFFYSVKPLKFNKFSLLMLIILISLVSIFNFMCIFSYSFALTSQFGLVSFLSLTVWSSFIYFTFYKNPKNLLSHLIPEGAPLKMISFLFLIEIASLLIRPLTLSIRLVANIMAGHVLMILLSSLVFIFKPTFIFYLILNFIEMLVALIQGYIYCTMISLYYAEVN